MTNRSISLLCAAAVMAGAATVNAADTVGSVFVIAMENHNWTQPVGDTGPQQIKGNVAAPYINSLIDPLNPNSAQVSYASNYLAAAIGVHPSEPNYLWAEAGTNYNQATNFTVNNDADPTVANKNIFTNTPHLTMQMNMGGIAWNNYQEDHQILNSTTATGGSALVSKSGTSTTVTNPYYGTNQYNYAAKHDPMAFFSDTATQNVMTFDKLRSDIAADTVTVSNPTAVNNFGRYNWITPNQYNDMHSSLSTDFTYNGATYTHGTDQQAIAIGDHFLSQIVPQLMATEAYKNNGAILLWMDETEGTNRDDGNHTIMEILISPLARGGAYVSSVEFNHSSDIKTMEEIFQLGAFLNNTIPATEPYGGLTSNTVAGANDLSDLFKSGVIPANVPEPASLGVLAVGGALLLARRNRR